jgi:hypothetical protein
MPNGEKSCEPCRALKRARDRAAKERKRAEGRCPTCCIESAQGKICRLCLILAQERAFLRYQKAKASGVCFRCGKPAEGGQARCAEHRALANAQDRARKQKKKKDL